MTRKEAIKILERRTTIPGDGYSFEQINEAIDIAISALRSVRQEQMNKVCKGKWIYTKKGQLVCSCCGFHPTYSHNSNDKMGMSNCRFCPNCGIEMG